MLPLLLVLVADPELLLRMGSAAEAGGGGGAEDSSNFSIVAGAYHSARDMESNRTRPVPGTSSGGKQADFFTFFAFRGVTTFIFL